MFIFIYPLLPWVGVMLLGYGSAGVFELPAPGRDALLLRVGLAITAAFFAIRAIDVYGDPNPWQSQAGGMIATIIDFLNTTKYPPSLAFLLMTLGPAVVLCAFADRITGTIKVALVMFGRVPFAFYVADFYLIHALSVGIGVAQGFDARQFLNIFFYPAGYGVSLPGVFAVWALVIVHLYPFLQLGRRREGPAQGLVAELPLKDLPPHPRVIALEHHSGESPSSAMRASSSQPMRLRRMRRLFFLPSDGCWRSRFSAIFVSSEKFCGALSSVRRRASSPKITSRLQCSRFSMPQ